MARQSDDRRRELAEATRQEEAPDVEVAPAPPKRTTEPPDAEDVESVLKAAAYGLWGLFGRPVPEKVLRVIGKAAVLIADRERPSPWMAGALAEAAAKEWNESRVKARLEREAKRRAEDAEAAQNVVPMGGRSA